MSAFTLNEASRRGSIYLDGVLDRSAVFSVFTPQTVLEPTFGKASWYGGAHLSMTLDEVHLYPTDLSAQQVAAEMTNLP